MDHIESPRSADWPGPIAPFMRLRDVIELTGLARSTIYRMVAEQTFPAPVRCGARAVRWRQTAVWQWCDTRPSTLARGPDL